MNIADPVPVAVADRQLGYIQWGPAIAGGLATAALVLVLDTFALAVGLAVSSTAPTWRDSSMALQLLSGLYLVLVAIIAFGVGGYLAGRLRAPLPGTPEEVEFRDGTHGLVVWAIAMVLGALLTWAAAQSLTRLAAPSAGSPAAAQSGRESDRLRSRSPVSRRAAPAKCGSELCPLRGCAHPAHERRP